VGFSTQHKGGYLLWNAETDRVVTRGDVHSLTFYPDELTACTPMHTQQLSDDAGDMTTIIYEEEDGVRGRVRSSFGQDDGQSLSLSQISHADDSVSHLDDFAPSFGSGSVADRTPPTPPHARG